MTDPSQQPSSAPDTPARRVLLIEDNRDAAESLQMLLELRGHDVRVAVSGPEGLRLASNWNPQVVFCDLGLPGGMNGYEVARCLRRQDGLEDVLLVALSGYEQEESRQQGREAGFNHYLTKPADPEMLLKLLS
jgi:CheY-like chemotaxis protein